MARKALLPPSVKAGIPQEQPVPDGWSKVSFGDVLEVIERPAKLDDGQEYQLVTAKRSRGGVVPRERLRGRQILTKTQFYTQAGDFLISRRQIIHGACGIVPEELNGAVVSNEYTTLRNRPSLDINYLLYLSYTPHFQQCCFHSSVGVDVEKMVFKLEAWLKQNFSLPPIKEQRRIAAILGSIDDAIEANQAVISQTRKVKVGLLHQLFTRGIGHTRFKKTEIGEIPENWEVRTIGSLLSSCIYGVSISLSSTPIGTPVLRMGNIRDDEIDLSDLKYADLDGEDPERVLLRPGDLLFNRTNSKDLVGKVALVRTAQPLAFASYLLRMRVNESGLSSWLWARMAAPDFQLKLREIATPGVSQANINPTRMRQLLMAVPPIEEQEQIVGFAESYNAAIEASKRYSDQLMQVRTGLLNDLLSGRTRVGGSE